MSLRTVQSVMSLPGRTFAIRYLFIATAANLFWEIAQLPLYTIWKTASGATLVYAVVHCTVGDTIILAASLFLATLLVGKSKWPEQGYARVILAATVLGASYTIVSEWWHVDVLKSWTYSPAMPLLPPLGTGLTPFLQWLIIPPTVLLSARLFQSWHANALS